MSESIGFGESRQSLPQHYLEDALGNFRAYKQLAEKALAQLSDEELFVALDEESNSIAVLMKHIAGNMFSRWTDFLTSDGEKPNRNRDAEFVIDAATTREQLTQYWESGWQTLFGALEPLTEEDFQRYVLIRGEKHSIIEAINRQLTHYASHIGQILFLAKHFRSTEWRSLSIPRNKSAAFNAHMDQKAGHTLNRLREAEEFARDVES